MRGKETYKAGFSMDQAKVAGLAGKDVWKKYPRQMILNRALIDGCRRIGPDLMAGFAAYIPEELEDIPSPKEVTSTVVKQPGYWTAPNMPADQVQAAAVDAPKGGDIDGAVMAAIQDLGKKRLAVDGPGAWDLKEEEKWYDHAMKALADGTDRAEIFGHIKAEHEKLDFDVSGATANAK
jgi:hypothetical protein